MPGDDDAPSVSNDDQILDVYNQRNEFPIAIGATGFLHVLVAVLAIVLFAKMSDQAPDRSSPPLDASEVIGLPDIGDSNEGNDRGAGSPGSGGDPFEMDDPAVPVPEPLPTALPEIKPPDTPPLIDPKTTIPPENFKENPKRKGTGDQPGRGNTGQAGSGPGGDGVDSTRGRRGRWQILFNAREGQYFKELDAVKARLFIPVPGKKGEYYYYPNILSAGAPRTATPDELGTVRDSLRFTDNNPESAREAAGVLRLPFTPSWFEAVFPKQFEQELAAKEEQEIRNQHPGVSGEELKRLKTKIRRTIYRVRVHNGLYYISVKEIQW
jgi:hypothetical protein